MVYDIKYTNITDLNGESDPLHRFTLLNYLNFSELVEWAEWLAVTMKSYQDRYQEGSMFYH